MVQDLLERYFYLTLSGTTNNRVIKYRVPSPNGRPADQVTLNSALYRLVFLGPLTFDIAYLQLLSADANLF